MDQAATASPLLVVLPALLVSFLLAAGLVGLLKRNAIPGLRILDHPNDRSLHQAPVPRTGGIGVLVAVVIPLSAVLPWLPPWQLWPGGADPTLTSMVPAILAALMLATLLLAAVSLLDDRGHVAPQYRLATQLLAALLLYAVGLRWDSVGLPGIGEPIPAWLTLPLTLLFVAWMTNLYNFMDGMDGLAGGMAVFGFGALAVFGVLGHAWGYGLINAVIAAAAAGFLIHNLPRAGIFLGDLGSALLGFWASGSILAGVRLELFPLWAGLLVFSPFIVDATWTLIRRATRGVRVWRAHREHHYQRLVLAGWSTRRTLLRAYILMAAAGATAIAGSRLPVSEQWLLLAGWAAIYGLVHLRVELAERSDSAASTEG